MDLDKTGEEPQQSEAKSEDRSTIRDLAETCNRPLQHPHRTPSADSESLYRTREGLSRDVVDTQDRERRQRLMKRSRWQSLVVGLALFPIVVTVTCLLYYLIFGHSIWGM